MIWLLAILILNAAYVAALPSATVFYVANVLLHVGPRRRGRRGVAALALSPQPEIHSRCSLRVLLGLYLIVAGATLDHRAIL